MTVRPIHWHEGMFLRPQHFQSQNRYYADQELRSARWANHFFWGLRSIEIDQTALANYRFVARSLEARLRDGSAVIVPEDGLLPQLDLKPAFERGRSQTIYLAIPQLRLGRSNVQINGSADPARYRLDTLAFEDENTGVNAQSLTVRSLNLKLLLSTDDHSGYEVLPIARVVKEPKPEAAPELDLAYIPPLLACDGWKPMVTEILQAIHDRIGKKTELLATQVVSRNIGLDSTTAEDRLIVAQLRELNEAYAVLGGLAFMPGVPPRVAFLELCRIVGQLAVFGSTRRTPALPAYDHDDLGGCFYALKRQIDDLLNIFVEPAYKDRPFIGAGLRMQVVLEPAWLESVWQMYIGVQSQLDAESCIRLLTRPGQLDMKVGSSDRVDDIFRLGLAGLRFTHSPRPPRALPNSPGLIYFQINRESQDSEWQNVQKSLTLAIRFNELLSVGNIQGQQVLRIQTGGETTTLQFTLYVVPKDAK